MIYKFAIILLSIFLFGQNINAQSFMELMSKSDDSTQYTLTDYKQAFDDYWADYNVQNGYYTDDKGIKHKAAFWKQFNRWYNYMEPRVDAATGEFPSTSGIEEYLKWEETRLKPTNKSNGPAIKAASWTSVGPNSSGGGYSGTGRLNCVAFHPSDNNTFWVGSPSGGLWKTTNSGTNWITLTDDNDALGVSDIAIPSDYVSSSTIYIATGDRDGGSLWSLGGSQSSDNNSIGVLKSIDGGSTWNTTGLTYTPSQGKLLSKILVDPDSTSTLYVAGSDGIYKTTDGGTNWANVYSGEFVIDMEFKPSDPTVIYASTKDYWGAVYILVSTDSGANWTVSATLATTDYRCDLAVSANDSSYVYSVVATRSGGLKGVYKSTNSGTSFSQVYDGTASNQNLLGWYTDGSGGASGQGSYDLSIEVSPTDINEIYIAGVITHKSINGGTSFAAVNCWTSYYVYNTTGAPVVHADHHMLKYRPSDNTLFECNDGGLYNTTNSGATWNNITGDMVISQLYRMAVSQSASSEVIGGFQDNGSKNFSSNTWTDVNGGDGMDCQIDATNVNIQYASGTRGSIVRTTNHWGASTDIKPSASLDGAWVTPYVIDPNNQNTLYAAYEDVYKSTDNGTNWTKISTMNSLNGSVGNLRAIAVAPSNSSVIYVSDPNNIWITTNGGTAWTDITSGLPVSSNAITYIAVKNDDPNTLWVTFGNYNSSRVYESTDGGANWSDISTGLPNIPIMSIIQNTLVTTKVELYVGTDVGVYLKDGNAHWEEYNMGLPNVVVSELDIYYDNVLSNSRLYAASYGRGVWKTNLNSIGCTEPTTQASNFIASSITNNSMTISWDRGSGDKVLIIAKEGSAVDENSVSGLSYTANAVFGSGSQLGTGNYVVYTGTDTNVNISSLNSGVIMYYAFYEYNTADNCFLMPSYEANANSNGSPILTTSDITSLGSDSVSAGGNVSAVNGSNLTAKGVCWNTSSGPTILNDTTNNINQGDSIATFTSVLTPLSPATTYYYRAYATNSTGTSYGDEKTFTTNCGSIISYPYTQNFDSWTISSPAFSCTTDGSISLTACWNNVSGDDFDWDIFSGSTGSSGTGPTTGNGGSGNYLYTETSSCNNVTSSVLSAVFDLTQLLNPQLSFYYHMYGSSMGNMSVQISTDGGTTWSADLWTMAGDQGNSWQNATISLSSYIAFSNVILRFKSVSGSSYTSDMAIDDFLIEDLPTCPNPNSLTTSNITSTSVELDWTENGSATTWEIEYGTYGFTKGTGTIISTSSKPYALTNISGSTTYDWYMRSDCGSGDYSDWIGSSSFSTSCGIITTFPYKESFENTNCWLQADITNADGEWGINTGTLQPAGIAAQDGSKIAYFNSNTSVSGSQTRFYSPDIDISSINTPMVSFWLYHETGYSAKTDNLQFQVYDGTTWNDVGSAISRYNGQTNWTRYSFDISAYTDTVNIGFIASSDLGNDINIDNISVFEGQSTTLGQLTKCSPYFIRDDAAGSLYFYDDFTFSVEVSGDYDITADWTINAAFDGYLYLYSSSFDSDNPSQNLLTSNDDFVNSNSSKIVGQALTAGTDYIVVATTKDENIIGSNLSISIIGNSLITAPANTIRNGKASSGTHSVAATDASSRVSDYECDDIVDWTHYYDDNGTAADYSDDKILLSVLKNSNNLGATTVTVEGDVGVSFIDPATAPYVNTFNGWYVFNRYWLLSPTTEPLSDVSVRFYYTDQDFTNLNTALSNASRSTISEHSEMSFMKINDLNTSNYNPNPTLGHTNIPKAVDYDADGAWIYKNGNQVETNRWVYGSFFTFLKGLLINSPECLINRFNKNKILICES